MRRFLFLQGPSSPFFARLARELVGRGHVCIRVGACPGDRLYWWPGCGTYIAWRGRPADWGDEAARLIAAHGITDLVCLGDGRAFHRDAIAAAQAADQEVRVTIVEQGYLRPGLLTVEPEGTGGRSLVPAAFRTGLRPPFDEPESQRFRSSFVVYAGYDIAYHLSNGLLSWLFYPHYENHALHGTLAEWRGWIGKAARRPARRRAREAALRAIAATKGPLFLFPLQLETDYQIRHHGYRSGLSEALRDTVSSFLADAPADATLIVKVHPLDNGLAPWAERTAQAAGRAYGKRVIFLDGGDLDALLARCSGIVTVNSTVGLTALGAGVPVKALGTAIYDLDRLTDPQSLETFWQAPVPPDETGVADFVRFLKASVQVPGAFDGQGALPGARNVADRLMQPPALPS